MISSPIELESAKNEHKEWFNFVLSDIKKSNSSNHVQTRNVSKKSTTGSFNFKNRSELSLKSKFKASLKSFKKDIKKLKDISEINRLLTSGSTIQNTEQNTEKVKKFVKAFLNCRKIKNITKKNTKKKILLIDFMSKKPLLSELMKELAEGIYTWIPADDTQMDEYKKGEAIKYQVFLISQGLREKYGL